jgi:carboxylesterase type B
MQPAISMFTEYRYAAPHIGSLRFQEPQPQLQETVINTGSVAGNCSTQEDCILLDVYVPASAVAGTMPKQIVLSQLLKLPGC